MQTSIHPKYQDAKVLCACGNEFSTRSTLSNIKTDICSKCHPFFTGQQKLLDSAGRVERFSKRFSKTDGRTIKRTKAVQKKILSTPAKISNKRILSTTPTSRKKEKDKKQGH